MVGEARWKTSTEWCRCSSFFSRRGRGRGVAGLRQFGHRVRARGQAGAHDALAVGRERGDDVAGRVPHLESPAGERPLTGVLPPGSGAATLTFDPANKYLYMGRYAGSVYKLKLE